MSINTDRDFLAQYDPGRDLAAFEEAWNARGSGAAAEVDAFEPNYEGSPVVCGSREATPGAKGHHEHRARAGHHLSPQTLSDGRNVYERLGEFFSLLAFGDDEKVIGAFEAAAARLKIPLSVIRDTSSDAAAGYEARYVLVRPDEFVAWAGDVEPEDAHAVLARVVGAG
jgi:hypothetical protein